MKRLILILLCMTISTSAFAVFNNSVKYYYVTVLGKTLPTDVDAIQKLWMVEANPKGELIGLEWKVDGSDAPTLQWIRDNEGTADTWFAGYEKAKQADIDKWAKKEKAFAKLVFKEINKLRKNAGLSEYTWAQFNTALAAEMDN